MPTEGPRAPVSRSRDERQAFGRLAVAPKARAAGAELDTGANDDHAGRTLPEADGAFEEPVLRRRPVLSWHALLVGDGVALVAAGVLGVALAAAFGGPGAPGSGPGSAVRRTLVVGMVPLCQLAFILLLGQYRDRERRIRPSGYSDAWGVLVAGTAGSLAAGGLLAVLAGGASWPAPDPLAAGATAVLGMVLVVTARSAVYRRARNRRPTRVVIVGSGMIANSVRDYLARDPGTVVVGFVDDDPAAPTRVLGPTAALPDLCRRLDVDRILVSFSRTHPKILTESLRHLHGVVPIGFVPRYFELMTWRSKVDDLFGLPIVEVAGPSLSRLDRVVKRSFDVGVSALLLVVLSPLLVALAAAVALTSPGPVLFGQDRIGRSSRPFRMYKFRSMWRDAEAVKERLKAESDVDGPLFKLREDPRVTPVGRWIRRTSLDELPQLVNVLAGHMSLVGPRPFVPAESEQFEGWGARRFEVRPGLTGLWQVSGRNDLSYDDLRRLDYQYVASWSLAWDVKILWQTPTAVFRGRGAY